MLQANESLAPGFVIPMNIMGRLYSLTVLANLLARTQRQTRTNTPRSGISDGDFNMPSGLYSLDVTAPGRTGEAVALDDQVDPSSRATAGETSDASDRVKGYSLTEPI
ncbi:hypothetical protein LshimejAT787_0100920 [Lyophyllum shimeji]|uniref:Uncharacterized protein n=1 Tax=Lyophyllum shimeji TaxID=47721 RepID=A0A9P3UHR7_LYOSH|nr:hypothetical protein LshimejAT787_0100920 [Lyophyllum shimeji]